MAQFYFEFTPIIRALSAVLGVMVLLYYKLVSIKLSSLLNSAIDIKEFKRSKTYGGVYQFYINATIEEKLGSWNYWSTYFYLGDSKAWEGYIAKVWNKKSNQFLNAAWLIIGLVSDGPFGSAHGAISEKYNNLQESFKSLANYSKGKLDYVKNQGGYNDAAWAYLSSIRQEVRKNYGLPEEKWPYGGDKGIYEIVQDKDGYIRFY